MDVNKDAKPVGTCMYICVDLIQVFWTNMPSISVYSTMLSKVQNCYE